MSELAIRVEGLGKRYNLGKTHERYSTLRDQIGKLSSAPLRALYRRGSKSDKLPSFWALKDVSFEIQRGEVVGIIGRNGAGKSTLLKILSRITEPTEGLADIYGRVSSLLEVGTGFHPELSGRENVFLNGAILGMRREEITRKFDEIVSFAEVEKFIDTAVKHYSSGMYMRLAFAVAAHLEPEILIIDEVLAVGDAKFQKKCLGKMEDVAREGRTVLFVSHNIHAVTTLCSRALVLQSGRLVSDETAAKSVQFYMSLAREGSLVTPNASRRPGTGEWRIIRAESAKPMYDPAETKDLIVTLDPQNSMAGDVYLSAHVVNEQGSGICQCDSRLSGFWIQSKESVTTRLRIANLWLMPGEYTVDIFVCRPTGIIDHYERACGFEVTLVLPYPNYASIDSTASALILADFSWSALFNESVRSEPVNFESGRSEPINFALEEGVGDEART